MKITLINTGGTISCAGKPLAPMGKERFASAFKAHIEPLLTQKFAGLEFHHATELSFPASQSGMLDSTDLRPSDWCRIARAVLNNYAQTDAFIILHGTDTLDFTGTALPLLLTRFDRHGQRLAATSKPIILTGSQLPLFHEENGAITGLHFNSDAFQNLCGAVAAALSGLSEISVLFGQKLMRASRVAKSHSEAFHAFSSPNFPDLGRSGINFTLNTALTCHGPASKAQSLDDDAQRQAVLNQIATVEPVIDSIALAQINAFPAGSAFSTNPFSKGGQSLPAKIIDHAVAEGAKGIVLLAHGAGNFPSGTTEPGDEGSIATALKSAHAKGVTIVDCTRVYQGGVNYNTYAAGAWLAQAGALNPVDMTPMAAFAKLCVLLAQEKTGLIEPSDIPTLMQMPLVGEMDDVSALENTVENTGKNLLLPGQSLKTLSGSATLYNDPSLGPILRTPSGTVLWHMLEQEKRQDMPVRLYLTDHGELTALNRNGESLFQSHEGESRLTRAKLTLRDDAQKPNHIHLGLFVAQAEELQEAWGVSIAL